MCLIKHNADDKKNRSRSDATPENHRTEHSSPETGEAMEPREAIRQIRGQSGLYRARGKGTNEHQRRYPNTLSEGVGSENVGDYGRNRIKLRNFAWMKYFFILFPGAYFASHGDLTEAVEATIIGGLVVLFIAWLAKRWWQARERLRFNNFSQRTATTGNYL